jgi:hypothetical protein
MTTIAVPTIHSNGSDKDDLIEGLMRARNALHEAALTLQDAAPNGRDYYIQTPSTFSLAQEQNSQRVRSVVAIYDELGAIIRAIKSQKA